MTSVFESVAHNKAIFFFDIYRDVGRKGSKSPWYFRSTQYSCTNKYLPLIC